MPASGQRLAVVTPDDHGPILEIVAWFLFVAVVMATAGRLVMRFVSKHVPGFDDVVIAVASLFYVGVTVTAVVGVNRGLGKRESLLTEEALVQIQKIVYAGYILFYLTVLASKISIVIFFYRLAVAKTHLRAIQALTVIVVVWGVTAVFGTAFQCSLPEPWLTGSQSQCINMSAFTFAMTGIDIATEVAMICIPSWILWDLQMEAARKRIVFFIFALRLAIIGAAIARIVEYDGMIQAPMDMSFDSILYLVCTQIEAAMAVIVSCTPALKPFMDLAYSGMLDVSFYHARAGTTYGPQSYALKDMSGNASGNASNNASNNASGNGSGSGSGNHGTVGSKRGGSRIPSRKGSTVKLPAQSPTSRNYTQIPDLHQNNPASPAHAEEMTLRPDPQVQTRFQIVAGRDNRRAANDGRSVESVGSDVNIIRQTKNWDIKYDEMPASSDGSEGVHHPDGPHDVIRNVA